MSQDGPIGENQRGDGEPVFVKDFALSVSREGWIGLTFYVEGGKIGPLAIEPGLADVIHDLLAPTKRKELWEAAKGRLDKGLN